MLEAAHNHCPLDDERDQPRAGSTARAAQRVYLMDGGGRPEVQAAHIWPVEHDGPDTVRNGLALTDTAHWLFDRGLISADDPFRILIASARLPEGMTMLLSPDRRLRLPASKEHQPHPTFLAWHRSNRFKG